MLKNKKSLIKLIISLSVFVICVFAFAISASASQYTEGQEYKSTDGSMIYVNADYDDVWVVNEGKWTGATYDPNLDFENAGLVIRNAMYERQDSITVIIGFPKSYVDMSQYSENEGQYFDSLIFGNVKNAVYTDDGTPYGGDYLKQTASIERRTYPFELNSSKTNTQYCFVKVTYYFSYVTTAQQEEMVSAFVDAWNNYFITSNSVIQNASTQQEKEYYTVKTIYNFITKNTLYDNEVYKDTARQLYPKDSARYLLSHSAYGAIFGNIDGSLEEDFDISEYKFVRYTDMQGLYRPRKLNQGMAVCEGYSLLFYSLCKSNGIDCEIVTGDYTTGVSDPHAWNIVYLKDSTQNAYEWFLIDTTFASQRTQKLNEYYTVVDYSYYLRGTENETFSPQKHQQADGDYSYLTISTDDYRFEVGKVYEQSQGADDPSDFQAVAVIYRMKTDDPDEKFVPDGNYVYENYIIVSSKGNLYKIDTEKENALSSATGFYYYSTGYYYTCEFIDFAEGVEYSTEGKYLLNAGDYSFELKNILSNIVYEMGFKINPLPMDDLKENYDLNSTTINGEELSEAEASSGNLKLQTAFTGTSLDVNVKIVDSAETVLNSVNKDYVVYVGTKSGNTFSVKKIDAPGLYYIRIQYSGNYAGYIDIPFEITKADLSKYVRSVNVTFGSEIANQKSFNFGNSSEYVVVYNGTDYKITDVTPYNNVGDTGTLTLTALSTSKYFEAGTKVIWNYTVTTPRNITNTFVEYYKNKPIADQTYTGKAIEIELPHFADSTPQLVKGKDYDVTYKDNVNVGTATMTVTFKGNYTGFFETNFEIVEKSTPSGGGEGSSSDIPKVGWMLHEGYWVYVSKVETSGNKTTVTFHTGWLLYKDNWYYLIPGSGRMATGWTQVGGAWYYFNSSGIMQTGWLSLSGTWYYLLSPNGAMATGWERINNKWYYFATSGAMVTGFYNISNNRYYFSSSGAMVTGWQKISNYWYYFNSSGAMQKGWQKISNKWYYFDANGRMATGWLKVSNKWYFFNSSGAMATGWLKVSSKWYYFNSSGAMVTGWLKVGSYWYYFDTSGAMVTGSRKIGSKTYRFNSSGACLNP